MKQITTLVMLTGFSILSFSQSNSFNYNNAYFEFNTDGSFFHKEEDGDNGAGYFPEASEVATIFHTGFMIGGLDQDSNLHQIYSNYFRKKLSPGPLANDYQDLVYQQRFSESIWTVSKNQVENHKLHFWDQFYQTPDAILNWPGNGNVSNGESANLAPFEDLNGNGLYEPHLGDYPCIQGDLCTYTIMNDQRIDTNLFNLPLGIEVHLMYYQFLWPEVINQTTFFKTKIFNKSEEDYFDVRTGLLVDFDIGNFRDDFLGTDTIRNLFYGYNRFLHDSISGETPVFGDAPPATGIKVLNDELYATIFDTDPLTPDFNDDPKAHIDYYNLSNGIFQNGAPLTQGEMGFDANNQVTRYLFSGYRENGWTESENNPIADRKGYMSIAKDEFLADEVIEYDFAVVYGRPENPDDIWDAVDVMFENADIVQEFYDNMDQSCQNETADISEFKEIEFQVYPNPANDEVFVQLNGSFEFEIYNVFGKQVVQKSKGFQQEKIDLSHCAAGVYFVKVMQDGHSSIQKIILK